MSIEIRPAAVRSQLDERSRRLDAIASAVQSAYDRVDRFCGTGGTLKGAGYEAARVHMGQYKSYCVKVATCVEMAREADSKVKGALGRFGGMSTVSEREWLEKKASAQRQASHYRSEASRLAAQPLSPESAFGAMCARFSASRWDRQAEYASKRLSGIYSYCAETNGLYGGDLGKLTDAVRAGASAFASCRFDASANRWAPIDYSWTDDEVEAIASRNMGKLLLKGYGDVDRALIVDPIAAPVAKWWEDASTAAANWWGENGTAVKNVGKVVFGVVGVVGSIALIASGVGAPAGIAAMVGIAGGFMDTASGIAGLAQGKEVDWEKEAGRGVASAIGGDPQKAELAIEAVTTVASIYNISKLPSSAGKLIDSAKGLEGLGKTAKATDSLKGAFRVTESASGFAKSAPLFEGKAAVTVGLVRDACDFGDSVGGAVDIVEKGLDALSESKRSGYAGNAFAAAGNGD